MSSSTFEVRESESDSEKVLDFDLDACEENGIMSTQIDGELPKDHTYNKEPEWAQEDEVKEVGEVENSQPEDSMVKAEAPKARLSRSAKASIQKANVKSKAKKVVAVAKKEKEPRKLKSKKKDPIKETSTASEEVTNDTKITEKSKDITMKSEKLRGRKRKIEEKENVLEKSNGQVNSSPAKRKPSKSLSPVKSPRIVKEKTSSKGKSTSNNGNANLPKGWVRKTVMRKTGKSAGQFDVYIYSPDGVKFRSRPDLASYLVKTKSTLKLDNFDFSKKPGIGDTPVATKAPTKKEVATTKKAKQNSVSKKKKSPAKKSPVKGKKATKTTAKSSSKKKA